MHDLDRPRRKRIRYLIAIAATITAGLVSRQFPLLGNYPGDVLWALMVFLGVGFLLPRVKTAHLMVITFAISCVVEFLKLNQNPTLVSIRHSTLGHLVFGHVFAWQNLVAYAAGVSIGGILERLPGSWLMDRTR